ncbi:transcriptional regulator, AraC family [Beutenbergia cavernae DSM 12333]|uniref:Transcriptional regulator, AraC family n=1 Tax=Beutenbergia cavernae (strain ATCC BAA-8 / DSM 12333 / CCUG 43141 / JCM 11478 / NBRC 16432 / NCIMB 13614 / HKI 0122) TaxID=471853 RepID=C5BYV3_BEUC1|nr:DNA-binding transcriptional regulator [Beutenbergia cavernae]ACQ79061.1 transcriptional regulator, AraC family [Beutenbergia cavernae DSM 12333]
MPPRRTRHVALLVETSNAYARGLLAGVRKYVAGDAGWSLYLAEHSRHETDFSWLEGWEGDGVLARIENVETARFIRRLDLPTVDLSAGRLAAELPGAETDDRAIARLAVEHFTERGLRHFAFCGDERFAWSIKRSTWYSHYVRELGHRPQTFAMKSSGMRAVDRERLAEWLRGLPKPVGVLACYDIAGQEVLEGCKIANLAVPDAVAVLGVDNDELVGTLTSPALSSIEPDTTRTGYLAAEMLDLMMGGRELDPGLRLIEPLRVVARQSSDIFSVSDPLVAEALRYIRDRSDQNLAVEEVLRHVGLSRRSLDHRFAQTLGRTVHGEIVRVRMGHVAELLSSTDWTLPQIAERLEFSHSEYMGVAFKKYTGKSPGRYRRDLAGAVPRQAFSPERRTRAATER